jgi:hypothetical protein
MRTRREILEDVAAGRIDPAAAAALLDQADEAEAKSDQASGASAGEPSAPSLPAIDSIEVRATSRRVRLIGDPRVREFAVEGPHQVRREGSTLHITGDTQPVPTDDTFILLTGGRFREMADRFQRGLGQNIELTVRVRPDIAVGAEVIAGSLHTEGVRRLHHVRATAASLRVQDAEEPMDVLVQAGSAQVTTRQTRGRSRIRCESGSLTLRLLDGSDARVRHDVQLGKFSTQPEQRTDRDVVVGTGAAEIDVEVVMGAVTVVTPS